MCGLYGYDISRSQIPIEKRAMMLALLAEAADTRGGDSWGIYLPKANQFKKGLGDVLPNAHRIAQHTVILGHSRKATTGANTIPNAHPFSIGKIIGAHNGIIVNHDELNKKFNRNHEVDSMHIFSHINENRGLEDLRGYGAIEFVRKDKPNRIYLCKLSGGDLSIYGIGSSVSNCRGVVWYSVEGPLKTALSALNTKVFEFKIETGKVYYVENGSLYISNEPDLTLGSGYGGWEDMPDWRQGYNAHRMLMSQGSQTEESEKEDSVQLNGEDKGFLELWEQEEIRRQNLLAETMSDEELAQILEAQVRETDEIEFPAATTKKYGEVACVVRDLTNDQYVEKYLRQIGWCKVYADGKVENRNGEHIGYLMNDIFLTLEESAGIITPVEMKNADDSVSVVVAEK